ncbi:hypothetical protein CLV78_10825 [Aliiruegeria haliotis]|uniref:50S ribosomal protein L35 n=1 Tax=Aliiruegeria haliotis TaxID=1280846 RepID=A0A2T0RKN1_9RHOB|nr:hypothetical protein [Aliiruegeria haliotis]PRY21756.1 hypothetical protein CLV78_10825 [Aliiruegeria haliotis]
MDTDLIFILGLIIGILAVPALLGAYSEGRPPRAAAILVMIGGGLVAIAVMKQPGGYSFGQIPSVFASVVGNYLR